MKILHGFFYLLIVCVSCTKQAPLTNEEVIAVIKEFDDGWMQKNLKAVDSVLSPEYVYFTQSGGTFSRDRLVETAGSPDYSLDKMNRLEYNVHLYENTAIVSTRWQGKGIYKGVPFDEDQRCSITVVKLNNRVEILSEHCTPIRPSRILH